MTTTKVEKHPGKNTIAGAKGITFSGETFIVPETHDMVKTLFDPSVRKSICEIIIVTLLAANGLVFYFVADSQTRINIFIGLYVFWRLSYNFGIGWCLNQQSNSHRLVNWGVKSRVFSNDNNSTLAKLIKLEVQSQMGAKYSISKYPIEFNTWLIFRKFVDLILMSDFTTFICLVVACATNKDNQFLHGQAQWLVGTRLVLGSVLILFNLWVKINAHNTIKDYAWYWGDFFFRQINNEELIFDGVFEMVPHPMYSVGYIGYYGFALISKSYTVLVIALFGHFLQMIFLHFIENPHIDKIYGPSENDAAVAKIIKLKDLKCFDNVKPLVGLWNFNWMRASDLVNLIVTLTYAVVIPLIASLANSKLDRVLFGLAVTLKLFESITINTLLILQSYYKTFTKWYLSYNIPVTKSLNNWAVIYNSLINLTYSSFFGFNLYLVSTLSSQDLFITDYFYLRVFIGFLMVVTQLWINVSIIDLIGYFGWFYGDFFIPKNSLLPQRANLTKAGVYRYLNNPEQIFGVCGVIGITLVIPTVENIIISSIWVGSNFFRINFVEKLHMIKVYGEEEVLQDSGVTKTFKKHLLPELIQKKLIHEDLGSPRRRRSSVLSESIDSFIRDFRPQSHHSLSKHNLIELSQNPHYEKSNHVLKVKNLKRDPQYKDEVFSYIGDTIEVEWNVPSSHSSQDWIGLYKIIQTSYSRHKTLILSQGRWDWVGDENKGSVFFEGDKLFWEEGIYEFRYHLDGKHDVAYISEPFEIRSMSIEVPATRDEKAITECAHELKTHIFDKVLGDVGTIDSPLLPQIFKASGNVINVYERLSILISKSTGIKINPKFLIYHENEKEEGEQELTVKQMSLKLCQIQRILHDLSQEVNLEVEVVKKNV